jgi:hypothetical protein
MKDLGPLHYYSSISVSRDASGLSLSQHKYALDILDRAKMRDCNPVKTPVDTAGKTSGTNGTLFEDPTLFRSLTVALQYLTFTRPDISYAVQQVCMHMHSPRACIFEALKRIPHYVKGTIHMSLHITPSPLFPHCLHRC